MPTSASTSTSVPHPHRRFTTMCVTSRAPTIPCEILPRTGQAAVGLPHSVSSHLRSSFDFPGSCPDERHHLNEEALTSSRRLHGRTCSVSCANAGKKNTPAAKTLRLGGPIRRLMGWYSVDRRQ